MFWFSAPALMKEWQDRALTHICNSLSIFSCRLAVSIIF
nr:hypothetical protein [Helicobacter bilis]